MASGFIKLNRDHEAEIEDMLRRRPTAWGLLTFIALRANQKTGKAFIGKEDHKKYKSTLQGYRTDKKWLAELGLCMFKSTHRGTIATIIKSIFDINSKSTRYQHTNQHTKSRLKSKKSTHQLTQHQHLTKNKRELNSNRSNSKVTVKEENRIDDTHIYKKKYLTEADYNKLYPLLTDKHIAKIATDFDIMGWQVKKVWEKMLRSRIANNKPYVNWISGLRTWIRYEMDEGKITKQGAT